MFKIFADVNFVVSFLALKELNSINADQTEWTATFYRIKSHRKCMLFFFKGGNKCDVRQYTTLTTISVLFCFFICYVLICEIPRAKVVFNIMYN